MRRTFVWAVMGGVFCASVSSACSDGAVVRGPVGGSAGAAAAGPGSGGDDPGQGGMNGEAGISQMAGRSGHWAGSVSVVHRLLQL